MKNILVNKIAQMHAIVNGLLTGMLAYFLFYNYDSITIISPLGDGFFHSFVGVLILPAIIMAIVSLLMYSDGNALDKQENVKSLNLNFSLELCVKKDGSRCLLRAFLISLFLLGSGWMVTQFYPDLTLSKTSAAITAFALAGLVAYIESVTILSKKE